MKRRILSLVLAVMMLCCLLTACSGDTGIADLEDAAPAETVDAAPAETVDAAPAEVVDVAPAEVVGSIEQLNVGVMSSMTGVFDPAAMGCTVAVMYTVYDVLWDIDPETLEVLPHLAESWKYLDDYTLEVTLRDGVTFSNGNALEADDVLFSFERLNASPMASSMGFNTVDFENSTAEGLVLTLKFFEPNPAFVQKQAGQYYNTITDKQYFEEVGEEEATLYTPVGTGPYILADFVPDAYATFVRNENYWGEAPGAESITYKFYAEETTLMIDFENGVIDCAVNITEQNMDRVNEGEIPGTAKVVSQRDAVIFSLPCYVEEFEDPAVREAIAHAINYEAVTKAGFGSLGRTMTSTLFDGMVFYEDVSDDGVGAYSYDPELARQILADAGYSDGDISLRMVIVNYPANIKVAEALQANLADVGIDLAVEAYDIATAMGYFMASDLDISLGEFQLIAVDPSSIYIAAKSTNSNAALAQLDEQVNADIAAGEQTTDEAARAELYANIQTWFKDNHRWLPVCEKLSCTVYNEKIADLPIFNYMAPNFGQAIYN